MRSGKKKPHDESLTEKESSAYKGLRGVTEAACTITKELIHFNTSTKQL